MPKPPNSQTQDAHPAADIFHPVAVVHNSKNYSVLRLSPGPLSPYTPFDMILPEPAAFCEAMSMSLARYPTFMARNCNWTSILAMVKQPALVWKCWRPNNLGDYENIKCLWQAWDEGTLIEGVGRLAPLQLVDKEWGSQKNQQTSKGRLPSWQPHQDTTVSVHFFNLVCFS